MSGLTYILATNTAVAWTLNSWLRDRCWQADVDMDSPKTMIEDSIQSRELPTNAPVYEVEKPVKKVLPMEKRLSSTLLMRNGRR